MSRLGMKKKQKQPVMREPATRMLVLISVDQYAECEIHVVSEDVELLKDYASSVEKTPADFEELIDPDDHSVSWQWEAKDEIFYRIGEVGILRDGI